jgi:hypothetical protein
MSDTRYVMPEPTTFNGPDTRPMESVGAETEWATDRDWHDLESEARDFVKKYGVAAMLRCVAGAVERVK